MILLQKGARYGVVLLLLLCIFLTITATTTINVCAADNRHCPICGSTHDVSLIGGIKQWTYDMACTLYGADIISDDTKDVLRFNVEDSKFNNLWKSACEVYDWLATIGIMLVTVYVLYDLMTKSAADDLTAEKFVKAMIRLIVGIMLIRNGFDMVGAAAEISSGIFDKLSPSTPDGAYPLKDKCNFAALIRNNVFDAMVQASGFFIPWLIMLVAGAIVSLTCWTRVLDITVRVIFAPIGMADMVNDGVQSPGFKYLKKLFASLLQGAIIIATSKAYALALTAMSKMGAFMGWLMPIILAFVLIAMLFKASMIANDIVGQ